MHYFVINTKNYPEASGLDILRLARATKECEERVHARVSLFLAVPAFAASVVFNSFPDLKLLAQHVDLEKMGSSTGYLVPEIAKSFGICGSILNHSEHRLPVERLKLTIDKLDSLGMLSIVCAKTPSEISRFARLNPDFVAIEPPELIGSGRAVSKAKPQVINDSHKALEKVKQGKVKTRLLCGAGIVDPVDARKSIELGAEGILVASGVVKSEDWSKSINSLARELL